MNNFFSSFLPNHKYKRLPLPSEATNQEIKLNDKSDGVNTEEKAKVKEKEKKKKKRKPLLNLPKLIIPKNKRIVFIKMHPTRKQVPVPKKRVMPKPKRAAPNMSKGKMCNRCHRVFFTEVNYNQHFWCRK
jgi:hypothetical protein